MIFSKAPLVSLAGCLLLASCNQIVYFPIEVKTSSDVPLPGNVKSALVVDNVPTHIVVSNKTYLPQANDSGSYQYQLDSLGMIFKIAFSKSFSGTDFLDSVTYSDKSFGVAKSQNDSSSLPVETIRYLCNENSVDALLSVDWLSANSVVVSNRIYPDLLVDSIQTTVDIRMHVYSSEGKSLTPTLRYRDFLVWMQQRDATGGDSRLDASLLDKAVKTTTAQMGKWLSESFVPQWVERRRWYYTSANSGMKAAARLVSSNQWKKAARVWGELYDKETNPVVLSRLASNIALANEMTDDLKNALEWIEIAQQYASSLSKYDYDRLADFRHELTIRLADFKKLDQLGQ